MIPMNGFLREPTSLKDAQVEACRRVIDSGWYVLGQEGQAFESAWANYCGVAHAIGVANGMDAAEIALRALGIGVGDEVITTPMTAFATVLSILRSGATPVLADIDPETGLMDTHSARRCITGRTRAVMLVHLYGQVRQMDAWLDLCDSHGLVLIEDCAQAHGALWQSTRAGAFGRAAAFSFYPTKNLGALGDGGALVTNDEGLALLARQLRNYGQSERYYHPYQGLNSRLDELQAAILLARLDWLDGFTERRRDIARAYQDGIVNPAVRRLAEPEEPSAHVYHQYVLLAHDRSDFMAAMRAKGIETLIHYPVPVHLQESVPGIRIDPEGVPNSETFAQSCVSIPCHPQLTDGEVEQIIDSINAWNVS